MNRRCNPLILVLLFFAGCLPIPQRQIYASKLELFIIDRGRPVSGLKIERKIFKERTTKLFFQSATTDSDGRCVFETIEEQAYVQFIGEFNIQQDFSSTVGGVFLFSLQKTNYDLNSERRWREVPRSVKLDQLADRIRITLEAGALPALL